MNYEYWEMNHEKSILRLCSIRLVICHLVLGKCTLLRQYVGINAWSELAGHYTCLDDSIYMYFVQIVIYKNIWIILPFHANSHHVII